MTPAFVWPVERIDADGEPSLTGDFIKIGIREAGERRSVWLDLLDAEALAAGILALARGKPAGGLPDAICEGCSRPVAAGAPAYQSTPAGRRCLMCETCAPTAGEEDSAIMSAIRSGRVPDGFVSRNDAIAWRARLRLAYASGAKRLAPLAAAIDAAEIEFPEPPPAAVKTAWVSQAPLATRVTRAPDDEND